MPTLNAIGQNFGRFRFMENASLPFTVNWAGKYSSAISASVWTNEDGGVTISSESSADHTASAVLAPNNTGQFAVVNKVTLADGTIDERTIALQVVDNRYNLQYEADYVD